MTSFSPFSIQLLLDSSPETKELVDSSSPPADLIDYDYVTAIKTSVHTYTHTHTLFSLNSHVTITREYESLKERETALTNELVEETTTLRRKVSCLFV